MPIEIEIPPVGDSIRLVKVLRWLATEGDPVVKGQPILEIETRKAIAEILSSSNGVLAV